MRPSLQEFVHEEADADLVVPIISARGFQADIGNDRLRTTPCLPKFATQSGTAPGATTT